MVLLLRNQKAASLKIVRAIIQCSVGLGHCLQSPIRISSIFPDLSSSLEFRLQELIWQIIIPDDLCSILDLPNIWHWSSDTARHEDREPGSQAVQTGDILPGSMPHCGDHQIRRSEEPRPFFHAGKDKSGSISFHSLVSEFLISNLLYLFPIQRPGDMNDLQIPAIIPGGLR